MKDGTQGFRESIQAQDLRDLNGKRKKHSYQDFLLMKKKSTIDFQPFDWYYVFILFIKQI
jgi:hypothetical protein